MWWKGECQVRKFEENCNEGKKWSKQGFSLNRNTFLLAELRIGVRQMGSGVGGSSRVVVCYTPEQRGIRGAYLYEFLRHV